MRSVQQEISFLSSKFRKEVKEAETSDCVLMYLLYSEFHLSYAHRGGQYILHSTLYALPIGSIPLTALE